MSFESSKAVVQRWVDEIVNAGDIVSVEKLVTQNAVYYVPGLPPVQGVEQIKQLASAYRTAFPDMLTTTEEVIAEGNKVVGRYITHGTHWGTFLGIPPTGKQVTFTTIVIYSVVDGKIAQQWLEQDTLGMLQQLGVIPPVG